MFSKNDKTKKISIEQKKFLKMIFSLRKSQNICLHMGVIFSPFFIWGPPWYNVMAKGRDNCMIRRSMRFKHEKSSPYPARERERESPFFLQILFNFAQFYVQRSRGPSPSLGLMKWSVARLFANFSRIFVQRLTSSEKLEHNSLNADRLIWK